MTVITATNSPKADQPAAVRCTWDFRPPTSGTVAAINCPTIAKPIATENTMPK